MFVVTGMVADLAPPRSSSTASTSAITRSQERPYFDLRVEALDRSAAIPVAEGGS